MPTWLLVTATHLQKWVLSRCRDPEGIYMHNGVFHCTTGSPKKKTGTQKKPKLNFQPHTHLAISKLVATYCARVHIQLLCEKERSVQTRTRCVFETVSRLWLNSHSLYATPGQKRKMPCMWRSSCLVHVQCMCNTFAYTLYTFSYTCTWARKK